MSAPNVGEVIAQWTAGSTARLTRLLLGFIPDHVRIIANHTGTNPNVLEWFNKGGQVIPAGQQVPGMPLYPLAVAPPQVSQWPLANDHLLYTGSSGVTTRVGTGISAYFGGDLLADDNTINSNPVHIFTDGTFGKAGLITPAGIEIPAAILANNARYIAICTRRTQDQRVGGLSS